MNAYICTGINNVKAYRDLAEKLWGEGISLTYDWTTHGSVQAEGQERWAEVASLEAGGVLAADFVVGILPGGRGTHMELGMAIGANKPVVILATASQLLDENKRTCSFYYHPRVKLVETISEVLACIKNL